MPVGFFVRSLMPTREWCAWTAGIIDGEGAVVPYCGVGKNKKPRPNIMIMVRMCDKGAIDKLYKLWGGHVCEKKYKTEDGKKIVHEWRIAQLDIISFVDKISPWSVTKLKQLKLAKKMRERIESREGVVMVPREGHKSMWITAKEVRERIKIRNSIGELNRSGSIERKDYLKQWEENCAHI